MKAQLKPQVDPDFHALLNFPPVDFDKQWLVSILRAYGRFNWWMTRADKRIAINKQTLVAASQPCQIEHFVNTTLNGPRPCFIYYHGGGFTLPAFGYMKKLLCEYALRCDCDVLFVDYALAPQAKASVILEQCFQAVKWVHDNHQSLQINPKKVAVGGDSAGGALAASIAQMAFDQLGADAVCFQLLIYPVIDDSLTSESTRAFYDAPVWSGKASEAMWPCYKDNDAEVAYTVPMKREDVSGLANAYVETAEFDPLHDEGLAYADKLAAGGVAVVRHETRKTVHGYDSVLDSAITRESVDQRVGALKAAFAS